MIWTATENLLINSCNFLAYVISRRGPSSTNFLRKKLKSKRKSQREKKRYQRMKSRLAFPSPRLLSKRMTGLMQRKTLLKEDYYQVLTKFMVNPRRSSR